MRRKLYFVLLLTLFFTALASAAPIRVRDARGKVIALPGPPQRILSIAPSNTEILFALGLGPKVVGVTDFCDYPAQARQKLKVGGIILNMEQIVALKPDLVVAKYDFQKANVARLEALHLRVFAVDPKTVQDTLGAVLSVGQVTGTLPRAKRIVGRMQKELNQARRIVSRDPRKPRVLAVVSRKPLIVVGPHTFMDDALRLAGAVNVASDAKQPYPQFSLEAAVARKPDVMLLSYGQPQEFYNDPVWRTTPAVQHRKVYAPPFMAILERPGPRLTGGVLQLATLLHMPKR